MPRPIDLAGVQKYNFTKSERRDQPRLKAGYYIPTVFISNGLLDFFLCFYRDLDDDYNVTS